MKKHTHTHRHTLVLSLPSSSSPSAHTRGGGHGWQSAREQLGNVTPPRFNQHKNGVVCNWWAGVTSIKNPLPVLPVLPLLTCTQTHVGLLLGEQRRPLMSSCMMDWGGGNTTPDSCSQTLRLVVLTHFWCYAVLTLRSLLQAHQHQQLRHQHQHRCQHTTASAGRAPPCLRMQLHQTSSASQFLECSHCL